MDKCCFCFSPSLNSSSFCSDYCIVIQHKILIFTKCNYACVAVCACLLLPVQSTISAMLAVNVMSLTIFLFFPIYGYECCSNSMSLRSFIAHLLTSPQGKEHKPLLTPDWLTLSHTHTERPWNVLQLIKSVEVIFVCKGCMWITHRKLLERSQIRSQEVEESVGILSWTVTSNKLTVVVIGNIRCKTLILWYELYVLKPGLKT